MKVYTFYSDSHQTLHSRFLSSIKKSNPEIEVISDKISQECESGEYMKDGWGDTMKRKVSLILDAISKGDIFVHSDCDIVYLKSIKNCLLEELDENDIAFQNDGGTGGTWYCMGFFICKPSTRIERLFQHILRNIDNFEGNDQLVLNNAISDFKNPNPGKDWEDISYKMLSNKFFTYGLTKPRNNMPWNGEKFEVPKETVTFHANWTKGVQNKHRLLDYVSEKTGIEL